MLFVIGGHCFVPMKSLYLVFICFAILPFILKKNFLTELPEPLHVQSKTVPPREAVFTALIAIPTIVLFISIYIRKSRTELTTKLKDLENEVEMKESLIFVLRTALEQCQEMNSVLRRKLQEKENAVSILTQQLQECRTKLRDLENQLEMKTSLISELQTALEQPKETSRTKLRDLENQLEMKTSLISELQTALEQQKETSMTKLRDLENQLEMKTSLISELQTALEQQKETSRTKLRDLENQLEMKTSLISELQTALEQPKETSSSTELRTRLTDLEKLRTLENQVEIKTSAMFAFQTALERCKETNSVLRRKLQEKENAVSILTQQLQEPSCGCGGRTSPYGVPSYHMPSCDPEPRSSYDLRPPYIQTDVTPPARSPPSSSRKSAIQPRGPIPISITSNSFMVQSLYVTSNSLSSSIPISNAVADGAAALARDYMLSKTPVDHMKHKKMEKLYTHTLEGHWKHCSSSDDE